MEFKLFRKNIIFALIDIFFLKDETSTRKHIDVE